jgi:hypothetical protein
MGATMAIADPFAANRAVIVGKGRAPVVAVLLATASGGRDGDRAPLWPAPPRLARRGGGEAVPPLWQLLRVVWTMTVDDRPNRAAVAEFRLVSSTSVKWSSAASSLAFTLCPIFSITARSPCGVRNAISLQIARLRMWTELCTPHGLRLFDGDCVRSPGAEYTQFCPHETFASGLFDHCRVLER